VAEFDHRFAFRLIDRNEATVTQAADKMSGFSSIPLRKPTGLDQEKRHDNCD